MTPKASHIVAFVGAGPPLADSRPRQASAAREPSRTLLSPLLQRTSSRRRSVRPRGESRRVEPLAKGGELIA
jgi:hypothetical protein